MHTFAAYNLLSVLTKQISTYCRWQWYSTLTFGSTQVLSTDVTSIIGICFLPKDVLYHCHLLTILLSPIEGIATSNKSDPFFDKHCLKKHCFFKPSWATLLHDYYLTSKTAHQTYLGLNAFPSQINAFYQNMWMMKKDQVSAFYFQHDTFPFVYLDSTYCLRCHIFHCDSIQ